LTSLCRGCGTTTGMLNSPRPAAAVRRTETRESQASLRRRCAGSATGAAAEVPCLSGRLDRRRDGNRDLGVGRERAPGTPHHALRCAFGLRSHKGGQASNFHSPPTIVRSIGIVTSDIGFSLSGSRPRTTKSANLPASIDPLSFSSNDA